MILFVSRGAICGFADRFTCIYLGLVFWLGSIYRRSFS